MVEMKDTVKDQMKDKRMGRGYHKEERHSLKGV